MGNLKHHALELQVQQRVVQLDGAWLRCVVEVAWGERHALIAMTSTPSVSTNTGSTCWKEPSLAPNNL